MRSHLVLPGSACGPLGKETSFESKIQASFPASKDKDVQDGRFQADGRDGNQQSRGNSFVREKVISFLYISHRQADFKTCGWLDVFLQRQTKHFSVNKHTALSLNGAR